MLDEATKFRKLLIDNGLTAADVANELGVSHPTVRNWAVNKTEPNCKNIVKLSRLLNVPIEEIVFCFYDDE